MTVLGHAVLFEDVFTIQKHCVEEDFDAAAPLVGDFLKNALQRCLTGHQDLAFIFDTSIDIVAE